MSNKQDLIFEVIISADPDDVYVNSEETLLNLLKSNGKIWDAPDIKKSSLLSHSNKLKCIVKSLIGGSEASEVIRFKITLISKDYEIIHPIRIELLSFLSDNGFSKKMFVIQDDISATIANQIYPLIHKLESALRGYIMEFFIVKLGVDWWNLTADDEMKKKVNLRKNNEKTFSKYIDNKIYLIDFGELGKIVYELSSGSISKSDIVQQIMDLDENNPDSISNLKNRIRSNYDKYFKENFKEKKFQKYWEELEKIRHKVAHNNLFENSDLERCNNLFNELSKIIFEAINEQNSISLSDYEIEKIIENSIINVNEMLGLFLNHWQELMGILEEYCKDDLSGVSRPMTSPIKAIDKLFKEEIIDREEAHELHSLRNFRNEMVHFPSQEGIDTLIPEKIQTLKKYIEILKERLNLDE